MWKKRAAIAVLVLVVLMVASVGVIHTGFFQQWILGRISSALSGPDTQFSAGSLTYDLTRLRFTLQNVFYKTGAVEVRIDRATVDLPRQMPSGGPLRISEVDVAGVRVRVSPEPNPVGGSGPAEPIAPPNFVIDRVRLSDGSVSILREGQEPLEIPAFSFDMEGDAGKFVFAQPIAGVQPGLLVHLTALPVRLRQGSIDFGPTQWKMEHSQLRVEGFAEGVLQWSPEVFLRARWDSSPTNVMGWQGTSTSGVLTYSQGTFRVHDVIAISGRARAVGSVSFGPDQNSASATWTALDLSPVDVPAVTSGSLDLTWSDPEFNDAAGRGQLRVSSRRYGQAFSTVRIDGRRAILGVDATGFDTKVRADLIATMDQAISGRFRAEHPALNAVARGTVRGTFSDPRATASLVLSKLKRGELPPVDATADIDASTRSVAARDVVARSGESVAKGQVSLIVDGMRITGSFPDITVHLADFVPEASGTLDLAATLSGSVDNPQAQFEGSAGQPVKIRGEALESVEMRGSLNGDLLRLDRFVATQTSNQKIQGAGTFDIGRHAMSADVTVEGLQLERFGNMDGSVMLRASVEGTYEKPSVEVQGTVAGLAYEQQQFGDVTLNGDLEGMDVRLKAVSAKFSTTVDGTLRAETPYPFTAKIRAEDGQVEYRDYSATIDGDLEVAGQLQPFELSNVAADGFRLRTRGVRLEATGRMSDQIKVAATADLADLRVEGATLTGSAIANIQVSGSVNEPRIEGRVSTENASIFAEGMRVPATVQAAADFNRTEVVIDTLRAEWGSAIAQIKGRSNLSGLGEYSFSIENVHPEEVFMDLPVSGAVNLAGTARVNALELGGIEAEAALTTRSLQLSGVPLLQAQSATLSLSKGVIEVGKLEVEGGRTRFNVAGSVNVAEPALNLTASGTTDLEVLEGFISNTQIAGTAQTNIRIQGQPSDPQVNGLIELSDVEMRRQSPALIATGGSGTIELKGQTARLLRIAADLNDGVVTAGGTVAFASGDIGQTTLDIAGENIQWQYPDGLQAEVSTNLQLTGSGANLLIGGEVRVAQAVYGRDIDITQEVFRRISSRPAPGAGPQQVSALDSMRLNVAVQIPGEVLVLNNLSNLELIGGFRLTGTLADPVITGRLQALEGGEIYFGPSTGASRTGRDAYTVEQGSIDLVNPRETEPIFNFIATREVTSNSGEVFQVRLSVSGAIGDLKTEFTAQSDRRALSEPNIISLMLTGHTLDETTGRELELARNQALGYLSGVIQRSDLLAGTGRALGLDTVRIDPFLIAGESDLGARLTVGKDITRDFSLIFSQALSGAEGHTWIAQYNAFKGFQLRGINDSTDQEVRAELQHQIDFGGPQRGAPPRHLFQTRRLGAITFDQSSLPEAELRDLVTKTGKPFSAFQLQRDIEKLESFFIDRDYLNVQIRGVRQYRGEDIVDVTYRIQPGSRILIEFTGITVPDSVRRQIRESWNSGLFEEQTLANARLIVMRYMVNERYFQPDVSISRNGSAGAAAVYTFAVAPGPRFMEPRWVFRNAPSMQLQASPGEVVYSGEVIHGTIEDHYRSMGYIDVQVEGPTLQLDGQQALYIVDVTLGPQHRIGQLVFNGNEFLKSDELRHAVRSASEAELVTDEWIRNASRALESVYWKQGFNDVEVKPTIDRAPASDRTDVMFDIVEGPRQIISEINIEGDQRSDRRFIRSLFTFAMGDPVDYEKINQTRKRLYDTGMFRSVDLDVELLSNDNYVAHVQVEENAPWRFRYGIAYTDKLEVDRRELGFSTDLTYTNLFGRGVNTGASLRYDATRREVRFFSGLPTLIGRDVRTNFSVYGKRDLADPDFIADEIGFIVQQQWQMRNDFILSYDYNYKRHRNYDRDFDPDNPFAIDFRYPIARFNASMTRDTRDDILNATRGTFLSNSFELAPPGVGSAIRFLKNYAQFFAFRPVRERVTWASAFRIGLARPFGEQELIRSERFAAGGSTTIRGFKQNELTPDPGNASLILNQELRFPLAWWFSGAGFIEAGNVYPKVRDFNPFKLRYSPGLGVRVQTPFVLIRFDVGFNPGRRPGEDPYRFSFGIGQAF